MPWAGNADLPEAVRSALPAAAQAVWRSAANGALKGGASEESAAKQAWSAVNNGWRKTEEGWVRKRTVLSVLANKK